MRAAVIEAIDHRNASRAIRRLAVPTALMLLSDQLLGIAPLAEIAAASAVFLVFAIGLYAFTSGARILGAQAIGAGRSGEFGTIVRSSMLVPFGIALALAIGFTFGSGPLMHAMLPRDVAWMPAANYLALRAWSLLPIVLGQQIVAAFATAGDTKLGLCVLLVINAIHIPLLLVLALGLGTHHPLGLFGAGVSSLVAESIGFTIALSSARRRRELGITSSWAIEGRLVRLCASLSWPEFVFLTLQILPEPITIALLAPAGAATVAAFRALATVNDATWAIPGAIGDACETIAAQRIGARDYDGARAFGRDSLRLALVVCTITGIVIAALAWPLSALVTFNATLASVAALPLAVHVAVTLPLKGYAMASIAPIRGSGDVRWVMVMGIATTIIAIAGIAVGATLLHIGLWSMPFGWIAGWIFRAIATGLRLRSGDWMRRKLNAGSPET
jgi:Na+-driven multidrug efflux pump